MSLREKGESRIGWQEYAHDMRLENERLKKRNRELLDCSESLEWLLHLHHGVSKGGGEPGADEWTDAIKHGRDVLARLKEKLSQ